VVRLEDVKWYAQDVCVLSRPLTIVFEQVFTNPLEIV
jgi:hypothetical protein